MLYQEEISAILNDDSLGFVAKKKALKHYMTPQQASAILPLPKVIERRDPIVPSGPTGHIFLDVEDFDAVLDGTKELRRNVVPYYVDELTYVDGGRYYIIPFSSVILHKGKRETKWTMKVEVKDISCDGESFIFVLGDITSYRR